MDAERKSARDGQPENILSLELLKSVVREANDAVLITKAWPVEAPHGPEIIYVNKSFERMSGYKAREVIGKTPRILQRPDTASEELKKLRKAVREQHSTEVDLLNYSKSGRPYWINISMDPIFENGKCTHFISIQRDITERKLRNIQKSLTSDLSIIFNETDSLNNALQQALLAINGLNVFDFIEFWLIDEEKEKINLIATLSKTPVMKTFYKFAGDIKQFSRGEGLPGTTWKKGEELFWRNIDTRKSFLRRDAAARAGLKSAWGIPIVYNDEFLGTLILGFTQDYKRDHLYLPIMRELCAQLGPEISRKKLEDQLSRIFDAAPDGIILSGFDGYLKKVNPAFCEILGYTEKELTENPFIEFIHPEDIERTNEFYEQVNSGSGAMYFENRYVTKSGRVVWLAWSFKIFHQEKVTYSVVKDITEKKELEVLLGNTNRLARIGSWELDLTENKLYWTDVTRDIHETGPDYEPVLEEAINFYKEGIHRDAIKKAVEAGIKYGKPWDIELKIITGKGNERWVRAIGETEFNKGKCKRIYGSFQDIHDRKSAEEKLSIKSRHLEAVLKLNSALLNYQNWFNALSDHLQIIGEAVNSDRVYYFENRFDPDTGEGFTTQKLEWCREGIIPQLGNPDLDEIPFVEVPELIDPMLERNPSAAILSDVEPDCTTRHVMETQQIKAFMAIPVYVENRFHGFVGFDNCTTERYWSEEERTTLETITANLAIAITRQGQDEKLQKLYLEKNTILESIGDGFFTVNRDFKVTYWNAKAEELLFTPREKIIDKNLWTVFDKEQAGVSYQKYSHALNERVEIKFEDYYEPMDRWFDVNVYPTVEGVSVFFKDITLRKQEQQLILQKTRQLDAIARFNGLLISEENWAGALQQSLEMFGKIVEADRVYFFENTFDAEGKPATTSMTMEWTKEGFEPQVDNPEHKDYPIEPDHPTIGVMAKNKPYVSLVSDIEDDEFREFLTEQDLKSVLSLPVFVGNRFFGFIGFDECTSERIWSEDEIGFLKTISLNLASAIENEDAKLRLEKSFKEKNEILESIGDGFFALDFEYTVTYWNAKAETLLLTPKEKILNRNLWEVFDDVLANSSKTYYQKALKERNEQKFEDYYDKLNRWFDINVYPTPEGISVFFKDITERKQAEHKLRELNDSLQEKTNALEASNAELEQFAFVASHDLQEPLRMITSFMSRLEKKYDDVLDDTARKYIYFATDGARRMRQIILDLLEYSRVGRVDTEKEMTDLNELLEEVKGLNLRKLEESGGTIESETLPALYVAKVPFRQLMHNLISNGLKYQQPGNKPLIRVKAEEQNDAWKFSVTDNGIGISEEYNNKIFHIFQRLHGRDEYSGTGVGLAICKKIIDEHRGQIWVESEPGKGSTFLFTIPKNEQV